MTTLLTRIAELEEKAWKVIVMFIVQVFSSIAVGIEFWREVRK